MHRAARSLAGLAAWIAAGATFAHTGVQPHVHPHPEVDLYVVLVAVAGAVLCALYAGRDRRPPSE